MRCCPACYLLVFAASALAGCAGGNWAERSVSTGRSPREGDSAAGGSEIRIAEGGLEVTIARDPPQGTQRHVSEGYAALVDQAGGGEIRPLPKPTEPEEKLPRYSAADAGSTSDDTIASPAAERSLKEWTASSNWLSEALLAGVGGLDLDPAAEESVRRVAFQSPIEPDDRDSPDHEPEAPRTPAPQAGEAWRSLLSQTMNELERELKQPDLEEDERRIAAIRQRLLALAGGSEDEAIRPIEGLPEHEQKFWHELLGAAAHSLKPAGSVPPSRRVNGALAHLRAAEEHLATARDLEIPRIALCTRIASYGIYSEFSESTFRPGQELLLYVEVENFSVQETKRGHETEFAGEYVIYDAAGRPVAERSFGSQREVCKNRRRDFFLPYRLFLPSGLEPGTYQLSLMVTDKIAERIASKEMQFEVRKP